MNRPKDRTTPVVLLCLTAFLVLFPLCVGKPGMPLLGLAVQSGDELARVYLRHPDDGLVEEFRNCFRVAEQGQAPQLIYERITPAESGSQRQS